MRTFSFRAILVAMLIGVALVRTLSSVDASFAAAATGLPAPSAVAPGGPQDIGHDALAACRLALTALSASVTAQPFEQRLSLGTRHGLKTGRRGLQQLVRYLHWCAKRWVRWATTALLFMLIALLAPLLDRGFLRTWRAQGFRAFRIFIALAVVVYVRLLIDRRASMVGKGLLAVAIAYGIVPQDLVPDYLLPLGLIDDLIAVTVASRCFMRLCPERLIQGHATRATRAWNRTARWRIAARTSNE